MYVFVLDKNKQPLDPCHPARARELLKQERAAVYKRYPFTILIKDRKLEHSVTHLHRVKIDPGSKVTGMTVLQENTARCVFACEITHRGFQIRQSLLSRRQLRRSRRSRKTRYRKARFLNRKRKGGWLPPSLQSRIENILTWVNRLCHLCPISAISQELVKFDLQKLEQPEIQGVDYQRGELFGFEVKQYLLVKWQHQCAYCGIKDVPLQIEHIVARSCGGTNRVSNLTFACQKCNQAKGNQLIAEFLKNKPELLNRILSQAKKPLIDATVVNATRWELYRRLQKTDLSLEVGSGGRTKWNRANQGIDKSHWADSLCVGASTPEKLIIKNIKPLLISAKGHGTRQRCCPDKFGFPKAHAPSSKYFRGFTTGDIVKANIPTGKFAGIYTGRIAIRFRPSFVLHTLEQKFDVHPKYLKTIHKADGYEYK
ncbi:MULTISPECIES: RNA-guided endonuclease IscB [Nostoc]|uniref:HNH endonuclease n=1 Tax=Nostoc paludosum FACHB-159 TaxID=2692908 RepID=A0ABR8KMD5_9NOSO|nr:MULTISPECIES: RNA-guided endonuclease IscB [Nostoc]MBD2683479.1 HNH endonuclease [Nostoc sp. FACHB-857]MBD2739803.1 HNH endonuclease [Nostoc paludosum FACHB-159]